MQAAPPNARTLWITDFLYFDRSWADPFPDSYQLTKIGGTDSLMTARSRSSHDISSDYDNATLIKARIEKFHRRLKQGKKNG